METAAPGPLSDQALAQLFSEARTFSHFLPRPVSASLLREIHRLAKFGATSANCQPGRFWFLVSPESKARLGPALSAGNLAKTLAAPVTVIVAYDLEFVEYLPVAFPHADARSWFVGQAALIEETARRNGSLQGGYLMLAARAVGLDCGPMSGFDAPAVNAEFFPDGRYRVNFLCNLGYGDRASLHPWNPRLDFDTACRIL